MNAKRIAGSIAIVTVSLGALTACGANSTPTAAQRAAFAADYAKLSSLQQPMVCGNKNTADPDALYASLNRWFPNVGGQSRFVTLYDGFCHIS